MLSVTKLNHYYGSSHTLHDVDLEIKIGSCTALLGRNGVGKSTLLKCLMGVQPVRSGTVRFDGQDVTIEAHLLDFSEDLYGQEMRLDFVARLRDEIRFPSVEKLVERIEQDVAETRKVLDG